MGRNCKFGIKLEIRWSEVCRIERHPFIWSKRRAQKYSSSSRI